eukprot:scaffold6350_cov23-Cyclotella_meneghiniana.AAC.1
MERGMDSWCLAFTGCIASRADRGDDSNWGGNNFDGDERLLLPPTNSRIETVGVDPEGGYISIPEIWRRNFQ